MAQSVEAVIISGPRRGEIIQLMEDTLPELSEADLAMLNAGLDDVIAAIDRLSTEYRTSTETLRGQAEIARFKVEVERAELQLTRLLSPPDKQTQEPKRMRKGGQTNG